MSDRVFDARTISRLVAAERLRCAGELYVFPPVPTFRDGQPYLACPVAGCDEVEDGLWVGPFCGLYLFSESGQERRLMTDIGEAQYALPDTAFAAIALAEQVWFRRLPSAIEGFWTTGEVGPHGALAGLVTTLFPGEIGTAIAALAPDFLAFLHEAAGDDRVAA